MKKIQSQIDATDDETAKKGYYSSDAYTKLEKKKKKLGLDRQKTVVVSCIEFEPRTRTQT